MASYIKDEYNSRSDYPSNGSRTTVNVDIKDLIKYAILCGQISGNTMSLAAENFYKSIVLMSLELNGGHYVISDDYKNAETTYKACLSFMLGMISTQVIARNEHKIRYLFHLKDDSIISVFPEKHPDWFGFDANNGYVFESKGTYLSSVSKESMDSAEVQLKSVKSMRLLVSDSSGNKTSLKFRNSRLKRIITTSCFKNKKWCLQEIDPDGEGMDICIDVDHAIYDYYEGIYKLIYSNRDRIEIYNVEGFDFLGIHIDDYQIGIDKSIFEIFNELSFDDKSDFFELYDKINNINEKYDLFMESNEIRSSYSDGIIVCKLF